MNAQANVKPAAGDVTRFAEMVLAGIHREYPAHLVYIARSDADLRPPRELTPAFYGCFDWHSAVHGHWTLVRLTRLFPQASFALRARAAVGKGLTREHLSGELTYLSAKGREGFERPYGLAWLLQLCAELREWGDPDAASWRDALAPLESLAVHRLADWLPKLLRPVRTGEHGQSAFALGLALDWARVAGDPEFERLLTTRAREFFADDERAPIDYEPSGHDFLSPALGEADLMRRVMRGAEYVAWLHDFLPEIESEAAARWLTPMRSSDPTDGKLAHLDGLNLSRTWMLEGVAAALDLRSERRASLESAALRHRQIGLAAVTGEHYAGTHWLGTFAVYLLTQRGLAAPEPAER